MSIVTVKTQANHGYNIGDVVIFLNDKYFNNVIVGIMDNVLSIRKMKWYEDTDTVFLYCMLMMSLNFLILTFLHWF